MRKKLIAGNWKMHKTAQAAIELVTKIKAELHNERASDVVVCPPFTALSVVGDMVKESAIMLGAQDIYWEKEGAYTGEISASMIKDVGCSYVIIGHSERRRLFGETNETVNKKISAALAACLTPIVCVGETIEKRMQGVTDEVLRKQMEGGVASYNARDMARCVIAYEPVWAIGTGHTATPQQAEGAHAAIRLWIMERYGKEVSQKTRILYGGSVTPQNARGLLTRENIDGALVGGASLDAGSFCGIVRYDK